MSVRGRIAVQFAASFSPPRLHCASGLCPMGHQQAAEAGSLQVQPAGAALLPPPSHGLTPLYPPLPLPPQVSLLGQQRVPLDQVPGLGAPACPCRWGVLLDYRTGPGPGCAISLLTCCLRCGGRFAWFCARAAGLTGPGYAATPLLILAPAAAQSNWGAYTYLRGACMPLD